MENIIEIRGLKKCFKDFSLKGIDLTLPKGYIMGFIGPNGAGKSTTIKLMMNLIRKDSGEIKVFGLDHMKDEVEIKNRIGFVYDENHFYEELTVKEIVRVISPFYEKWDSLEFDKYMSLFELPAKAKIKTLSKGMKMKFSLAVALSHHAELLIMDEPTSGLDPLIRNELLDILSTLIQDENKAVFFSTHITTDLEKIADYITFINNGEIVLSDTKDNILETYKLVKGDKNILQTDIKNNLIGTKENEYGFSALTADLSKMKASVTEELVIERPSLEDLMLYMVRGDRNV